MPGVSAIAYTLLARTGIAAARRRSDSAPIFCFHNIVNDTLAGRHGDPSLHLSVTEFGRLLDLIVSRHTVIPLTDLLERIRSARPIAGTACVTFDDAYLGTLMNALPLLRRIACPATVFVISGAATEPRHFWWDVAASVSANTREGYLHDLAGDGRRILAGREVASPALPGELLPADWSMLEAELDATVVPGCHTATHRNLSALGAEEVEQELRESRQAIADRLGQASVLAYPYGVASPVVVEASRRAGFLGAVTLGFGRVSRRHHPQSLPRINIPASLSLATVECWASGLRLRPAPIRLDRSGVGTTPSGTGTVS